MVTQQTCLQRLRTFDSRVHTLAKSSMILPRSPATTCLLVRKRVQRRVARIGRFHQQIPAREGATAALSQVLCVLAASAKIGICHVVPTSEGSLSPHLGWLIHA